MDGNGRWATRREKPRTFGHRQGAETARKIITAARRMGIRHLTLYTFSKENWKRPKTEVGFLFEMLVEFLGKELPSLVENDIRLNICGDMDALPLAARKALSHALAKTDHCRSMVLNLALNYSGRDEIAMACRKIAEEGHSGEDITPQLISEYLYTAGQPDPELVIRTSGELRISNYLLFQCAYSEFYFTDTLWPDFSEEEFRSAVEQFARRERRFGATGEQIRETSGQEG